MRTFLICHEDEALNRIALPRWLASFSTLAGMIVLRETRQQKQRRIKREMKRVGFLRFLDVLAFRLYYATFLAAKDRQWEQSQLTELCRRYPEIPGGGRARARQRAGALSARARAAPRRPARGGTRRVRSGTAPGALPQRT